MMTESRSIAHSYLPLDPSTAGAALQDISNANRRRAEAPRAPGAALKGSGQLSGSLDTASEEAQSCLRSSGGHAVPAQQAAQLPSFASRTLAGDDVSTEQTKAGQLLSLAEEEADCVLRATTRRAARSSASTQPPTKASTSMRKPRQKAEDASQKAAGHSPPHVDLLDMEPCSDDERGAGAAVACRDDSEQSAACHTPAPSRRMRQVADDVEVEESDPDCAPLPLLPMTARRKGRFSAMQSSEVMIANLHMTQRVAIPFEKLL